MGKGSWWCYWTLLAAHGPGVVVKRKGTCYCTRTRGVSTSTETLPYITPVLAYLIGQTCAVHIELATRKTPIYRRDLAIAQTKSTASTKHTSSHTVYAYLPAIRTIKAHTPCFVLSGVSRLTCIALYLSQYTVMPDCTSECHWPQRAARRRAKVSVMFSSYLPAAVLHG